MNLKSLLRADILPMGNDRAVVSRPIFETQGELIEDEQYLASGK